MCFDEGCLLSYLDGEISQDTRAEVADHVAGCPDCRAQLARLESDRDVAADALAILRPTADVVTFPSLRDVANDARPPRWHHWGRYVAAAAAVVLVIASFSFAPVRTAAADLLHVFRVQNIQTIDISQADLASIGQALESGGGHVDLKSLGEAWVEGGAAAPKTVTLSEAQAAVDFPIELPGDVTGTPVISLQPAQTYKFKLNVAAINKALEAYGSAGAVPSGLDGKVFSVNVAPMVLATYGSREQEYRKAVIAGVAAGAPPIYVGQTKGPELIVPDGVDAAQLRSVLLDLPFLPQSVRDQLAAVTDWQSTLVIPSVDGTAHDITIDGRPAVLISPRSAARDLRAKLGTLPDNATVIWNENGVVRAVGGAVSDEKAIALAKSAMR